MKVHSQGYDQYWIRVWWGWISRRIGDSDKGVVGVGLAEGLGIVIRVWWGWISRRIRDSDKGGSYLFY